MKLWNTKKPVITEAMKFGIDHEIDAVLDFEKAYGKTVKCGLFVHRVFVYFGASPDRIWKNSLLEIKCSHVLRDTKPDAKGLESLLPAQQRCHFLEKTTDGGVQLKRGHKYYMQCQLQMFVTGYRNTIFLT